MLGASPIFVRDLHKALERCRANGGGHPVDKDRADHGEVWNEAEGAVRDGRELVEELAVDLVAEAEDGELLWPSHEAVALDLAAAWRSIRIRLAVRQERCDNVATGELGLVRDLVHQLQCAPDVRTAIRLHTLHDLLDLLLASARHQSRLENDRGCCAEAYDAENIFVAEHVCSSHTDMLGQVETSKELRSLLVGRIGERSPHRP